MTHRHRRALVHGSLLALALLALPATLSNCHALGGATGSDGALYTIQVTGAG